MSGEAAMRADRLAELLERLRGLDDAPRGVMLDGLRRDDPDIAADLEMLLAATPASIEEQIRGLATSLGGDAQERIGPYRILGVIGEGGFGIVHIAEQVEPVHRIVALKVIKPGMDTREVLTRFRHEVQALGAMDHPSIPAVLDAGETPDHRPFVVMPLIPGSSITQYCLEQKLDVNGRVRLLLEACRAIQHAHSRGVIHRDLKPDNILVSQSEGVARPAIIDFGLAKALAPLFDGRTAVTLSGQVVGTPEYMAPEQAEGPVDVDVRADVYSLGAILFELLAGRPPFTAAELRAAGQTGMRRILAEQDPPPPSRFATLPRELDWICARCLEKAPERRYPTADALASDLERFLEGREVVAGPVGGAYRLWRRVVRHRAVVIPAAVALGALIIAAFIAVAFALRANAAAAREATVSRLTREILTGVNPRVAQGRDPELLIMMLDKARRVFDDPKLTPAAECELRETFALAYYAVAAYPNIPEHSRRADDLIIELEGRDSLRRIPMLEATFWAWRDEPNPAPNRPTREDLMAEILRLASLDDKPDSTLLLEKKIIFARSQFYSLPECRELLDELTRRLGTTDRRTISMMREVARMMVHAGVDGFIDLYAEARRLALETFGPDDPLVHEAIGAETYALIKPPFGLDKCRATTAFGDAHLADAERVLGWRHPGVATGRLNVAMAMIEGERLDDGLRMLESALDQELRSRGKRSNMGAWIRGALTAAAMKFDRFDIADRHEAVLWQEFPEGPPVEGEAVRMMVRALHARGDTARRDRWLGWLRRVDLSEALPQLEAELGITR